MVRKASAGHVAGGKVYGYINRDVAGPDGRRNHVVREVDAGQAAVVRRIFEWYVAGAGIGGIAKHLNAEGIAPPRARGWAPSAVREMLRRDLYRGVITWNRSARDVRGGVKRQRRREEREWIRREAPELASSPLGWPRPWTRGSGRRPPRSREAPAERSRAARSRRPAMPRPTS